MATVAFKDYYRILGVSPLASEEEIKKAYRRLAKQYHPDQNQGNPATEEKFKEINEAYHILGDKEKRMHYDLQFQRPSKAQVFVDDYQINDLFDLFCRLTGTRVSKIRMGGRGKRGFGRGCRGRRKAFFDDLFR